MITGNITIKSENAEYGIETNADSVAMDANNVQKNAFTAKPYVLSGGVKSYLSGLSSDVPFYFLYQAYDKSDNEVSLQNTGKKYGTSGADVVADSPYNISIEDSEASGKVSYIKLTLSVNGTIVYTKRIYLNRDLPIAFARSEAWSTGLTFKNGQVIIVDNVVYQWDYPHAGNSLVNPSADISSNPTTTHWTAYQQWTVLATKIIMAAFALLGGAVFSGDYMYSQQGKDANGNATSNYNLFDATKLGTSNCPFTPNLYFNYKTGDTYQGNGTFYGTLTPFLLYTPFNTIVSDSHAINPTIDGNCISIKPIAAGHNCLLSLPDATTWKGLHIYIRIWKQAVFNDIVSSYETSITSDMFLFNGGGIPIGSPNDSSYGLFPSAGVYEFVSIGGYWVAVNYPTSKLYDVGSLILTSSPGFNITDQTTVVSKSPDPSDIYLPENPFVGQCVEIFRRNAVVVVHATNYKVIWQAGGSSSLIQLGAQGDSARFKYDGEMWDCIYYSI